MKRSNFPNYNKRIITRFLSVKGYGLPKRALRPTFNPALDLWNSKSPPAYLAALGLLCLIDRGGNIH